MEKSLFTGLMRKAALACYAVGIFAICGSIAQSLLSAVALNPIMAAMSQAIISGHLDATLITQFGQVINTILPLTILASAITLVLTIVFAYYTYRVGQAYEISPIKIAGPSYVIWELAVIPLLLVSYQLLAILPLIISDPYAAVAQLGGVLLLSLLSGLLAFVFMLVFIITFMIGLNRMGAQTGIGLFQAAMWIALVGVILSFLNFVLSAFLPINIGGLLLQISIIVYGLALSRAGKQGAIPKRPDDRIMPEQG